MYRPFCQTSGRIELFIPPDIFNEYKQSVMDILNTSLVRNHFTYDNVHFISNSGTASVFELIPIGSLLDSTVIRNLLHKISDTFYHAYIPHRISVTVTSPFREEVKELLLRYFVWINKDIEFQGYHYERTVVALYRSVDYGTKHYVDHFRENLEDLDKATTSFNRACGLEIGIESNQAERFQIFKAHSLLNT